MRASFIVLPALLAVSPSGQAADRGRAAAVRGDLNGDGFVDLVLRDFATPAAPHIVWFMHGATRIGTGQFSPARLAGTRAPAPDSPPPMPFWMFCGSGDFDGDGRNDVVFSNEGTGPPGEIWLLDADLQQREAVKAEMPLGCRSVNDFDGDGDPDILIYKYYPVRSLVVWLMDGTSHVGDLVPQPSAAANGNWDVVGTDDLDADGFPDLLWYNRDTHRLVQWLMDGSLVRIGGRFTSPADNGGVWPAAVGDFGSGPAGPAGVPDVVWPANAEDRVCCHPAIWWMDAGGNRIGRASVDASTVWSFIQPVAPR